MPITFSCACGQSITVADQFAGKVGRCPGCRNGVTVPLAGPPPFMTPVTPGPQPRPMTRPMSAPPMPPPAAAPPVARSTADGRPPTQGGMARPGSSSGPAVGRPATGRPAPRVAAMLQVVRADSAPSVVNKTYPLVGGRLNVIGREPTVDIPIPSERISRRHCQLEATQDGVFVLTDLGSSNGTLVNQDKIQGRKVLLGGEYIQIGDVLLRFVDS